MAQVHSHAWTRSLVPDHPERAPLARSSSPSTPTAKTMALFREAWLQPCIWGDVLVCALGARRLPRAAGSPTGSTCGIPPLTPCASSNNPPVGGKLSPATRSRALSAARLN